MRPILISHGSDLTWKYQRLAAHPQIGRSGRWSAVRPRCITDHPVQRGVRRAPLTVEGGLPSWVRSVQGSLGRFVQGRLLWRPLVVERLHEVLVTARGQSRCTGAGGPGGRRLPARWQAPAVTSSALIGGLGGSSRPACAG